MAEPGPYAYAEHLAELRLGLTVAPLIIWAYADTEGVFYGQLRLAADPTAVILRTEPTEPGAERLQVNVTCPADPDCHDAYDYVDDAHTLLLLLEGNNAPYGDVECYTHDLADPDIFDYDPE
jgi:hypothetical protein